jgi:hypothetical protein
MGLPSLEERSSPPVHGKLELSICDGPPPTIFKAIAYNYNRWVKTAEVS